MKFSVNFLERREGDSPSIERVFRAVAENITRQDISTRFTQATYGNSFFDTLRNLAFFRPKDADIYHITGHISYLALVLPPQKTVLTIHDLTVLDVRTGLRRWLIRWLYFVLPARRAGFVTAISNATKEKLVRIGGIPADRVTVIENPVLVAESSKTYFDADRPRILQIGTRANKNLARLIEALAGIRCRLQIIGPVDDTLKARIEELRIEWSNQTLLGDEAIETAYEEADIVTLCSTDEGFGLPIIEAQAKSTVVVTSDRSPMKEVAGSGARLVDPESVESIRDGIVDVIENTELRGRLVADGKRNIKRFDPDTIAAKYIDLYEKVIESSTKV